MSKLYSKTKMEISNLENIRFSKDQWDWFYKEAVEKRLNQFSKKEASFIKAFTHMSYARGVMKHMNEQMDSVLSKIC